MLDLDDVERIVAGDVTNPLLAPTGRSGGAPAVGASMLPQQPDDAGGGPGRALLAARRSTVYQSARSGPVAGSRYGALSNPENRGPYWRRDEAVAVMALAGASARRSGCLRANAGPTSTGWRPRRQWRWRVRRCPRTATAEAISAFNSDRAYRARRHLNPNALVGRSVRGHTRFRRRAEHELRMDGLQTRGSGVLLEVGRYASQPLRCERAPALEVHRECDMAAATRRDRLTDLCATTTAGGGAVPRRAAP
jgi:hypothetical protein